MNHGRLTFRITATTILMAMATPAVAAPVQNWISIDNAGVATGTITDGATNSPTIAPADGIQVLGAFPTIALNDGEFVRLTATMEIIDRTEIVTLQDQVRIGLFRSTADADPVQGTGLSGIILEHRDQIRELRLNTQLAPFNSGTQSFGIGTTSGDPEMSTPPAGANVTLEFMLQIARDGEEMEITGTIGDGVDFKEQFLRADYNSPIDNPPNEVNEFRWNRAGFLIGGMVNATSVNLLNVEVVTGTSTGIPGDFNNDNVVDGDDLTEWRNSFGGAGADADGDGDSDGADFLAWQQNLGMGGGAVAAAVVAIPEPSSLLLVGVAGLAALACRRNCASKS